MVQPEAAFVSVKYSHPSALFALQNQGIRLIPTESIESIADVQKSLLQIGKSVDKQDAAELLSIFIESALLCIENRLVALNYTPSNTQYLNFYTQYYFPLLLESLGTFLND